MKKEKDIKGTLALTENQYKLVKSKNDTIINYMLATGLRAAEVFYTINDKDLIVDERVFIPVKYSNGKDVSIILTENSQRLLTELRNDRKWLYDNVNSNQDLKAFEMKLLRYVKNNLFKWTGCDLFSPHSLRKTFATNLAHNANANIPTIQSLMNHADISTTMLYITTTDQQKLAALKALESFEGWEGKNIEQLKNEIITLREQLRKMNDLYNETIKGVKND